jgi:tellurite methyltransferase
MQSDRLKWDEKHAGKTGYHPPDTYLIKHIDSLQKGHALDIACGRGRNALYLARQGFQVTAVDISEVGLTTVQNESKAANLGIRLIRADLDTMPAELSQLVVNSVIIINFKPTDLLLKSIPAILTHHGSLLWCSYNELQAAATGFPAHMALHQNEFCEFFAEMKLLDYSRFEDDSGYRDGYLFQKSSRSKDTIKK